MNSNDRTSETPADEQIASENVERLLAQAYAPDGPDADFVERVSRRVAVESQRMNSAKTNQTAELATKLRRRLFRWETIPWTIVILLLILLVALPKRKSPVGSDVVHQGDTVWIDGKAYKAAEMEGRRRFTGSSGPPRREGKPAGFQLRPVKLVGDYGLTPRQRPASDPEPPIGIGDSISTKQGERRRVSLPDGSTLYVNDRTSVTVDGRRSISLECGQVFLEVAPRNPSDVASRFVVKTPGRDLTALGTKFAAAVDDAETALLVTQGKVQVSGVDSPIRAGQQLNVRSQTGESERPAVTEAARASHLLGWTRELMASAGSPLVPASDHRGGSLIAVDPDGQEMKLSLRNHHVDVHIQDGFARTTIDQTYFNHKSWRLEGTFYFPLPPDASISRLAMYVNGRLMEGGMCEREHARNVFETIKHRALDPALLEWVDGSTFKMRVFPLEGRQEKRIILSYTQRLPNHYGRLQYRFPVGDGKESIRQRSVRMRIADGNSVKWRCDSHEFKETVAEGDLVLTSDGGNVAAGRDIVLELEEKPSSDTPRVARFSTVKHDGSQYFMVRYRPQLETKPRDQRRDWVFLFESDGSRDPLLARVQVDVIQALLKNAEHDDRFAIVTAGTRAGRYSPELKPATAENVSAAIKALDQTHLIGGLDLAKALEACGALCKTAENPALVHVGGGVPILGERREHVLLARLPEKTEYVGVGVGKRWNRSLMKAAAAQTGGYFTQINPDEPVAWRAFELMATLNTPRLLDLQVKADGDSLEFLTMNESAVHGEEVCAIARLEPDQELHGTICIHGRLDGHPFERSLSVDKVDNEAGYLPRQWAKLAIDAMVSDNADNHKTKIIQLSKSMYVMSPFTSLLVLENDEMYEQYNVDRGRKDHWALYPCPEEIEVVHEPLVGPPPEPAVEKKKSKPSPRTVLNSLLVRSGRYGFTTGLPTGISGLPIMLPEFQFTTVTTTISIPDGGTILIGGIRRRVSIDDLGPSVMFGLDAAGLPTADFDLEFAPRTYHDSLLWETHDGSDIEFDRLIELIRSTIDPGSWEEVGGSGSIEGFSTNLSLVISQRQSVHDRFRSQLEQRVYPVADLVVPLPPLYPPREVWERLTMERQKFTSVDLTRAGGAEEKIFQALAETTHIEFVETPLSDVLDYLEDLHGIQIELDEAALANVGLWAETPVTRNLKGVSLRSALRLLLRDLGLAFTVRDEVLLISAPEAIQNQFGPEILLPIRAGSAVPDWSDGRDSPAASQGDQHNPQQIGRWARAVRQRLRNGSDRPSLLYATPAIGNERRQFRHLMSYAPGMSTTWADVLAALEREAALSDTLVEGKIDGRARELIEAARARPGQSVTLRDVTGQVLLQMQVDGRGRYRYERKTQDGLSETVVCDGQSLWHLYPELGLGAQRELSRFHRTELQSLIPWHLPAANDLAIGADLKMVEPRTVAVVPHRFRDAKDQDGKPTSYRRVHLEFSEDGRLVERRWVEMPSGKTIARVAYAEDGTVRVLNADGKTQSEIRIDVTPASPANLKPETEDLVVLPMPIRTSEHIFESVRKREAAAGERKAEEDQQVVTHGALYSANFENWSEEDALSLLAADYWQDPRELKQVIGRRFFAKDDRRIGFCVLLLSSWDLPMPVKLNDGSFVEMNPTADHPDSPLAHYIASQMNPDNAGSLALPPAPATSPESFIGQLSKYQRLYTLWRRTGPASASAEQSPRQVGELLEFIERAESPTFAFALLRRLQTYLDDTASRASEAPHQLDKDSLHRRIAEALSRFEKRGVTSYVVQYELARALAGGGNREEARRRFLRLYRDTISQGILPPIDHTFVKVVEKSKNPFAPPYERSEQLAGNFHDLMCETSQRLIDLGRRPESIELAWQCRKLGLTRLADKLLQQSLEGAASVERDATTLAAIEHLVQEGQHKRALALLQPLLDDERLGGNSELWYLAAEVADQGELLGRGLHFQERAVELELRQFESTVNLQWVRNRHGGLLDRYGKLADVVVGPGREFKDELSRGVVKTADRWRSLDSDQTTACQAAARVFSALGQDDLAWDYLTTPLALKPNEAAPWLDLARSMRDNGQIEMADRAYAAAFEAEPTNAEILWEHAQLLDRHGQKARAIQLYSQIAGGRWQPRFDSIRRQAKSIVHK